MSELTTQAEGENSDDRLMELVEAGQAMLRENRAAGLAALCPDDPAMVAEVLDRLEWEEKMGNFLRDPIVVRPVSRADAFAPGALVAGRYRITREIGRGRWAVVLEALDTELQRKVALKLAIQTRDFPHPPDHEGLVKQYEYVEIETLDGPAGVAVREYLEGPTLAVRLREEVSFPAEDARAVALRLCQVLAHAEAAGFQPAGLNANDIVLTNPGTSRGPVLICDWLVANRKTNSLAADLTSVGLILSAMAARRANPDPDQAAWQRVVRRCFGHSPETRYGSLQALEQDLKPAPARAAGIRRWFAPKTP